MQYKKELLAFDEFFSKEYKYLKGFTKSINPQHFYEDTLNDCYLKCRNRIEENGYQGEEFMNFTRVTIMNHYKSEYRREKKKTIIDIESPDYSNLIEETLSNMEDRHIQDLEKEAQNSYIVTMIYEYLNQYYNEKDKFVFKTYFLLKHKHLNYKQLALATGMSVTSVSNIIKKIKQDLRLNLKTYILTGKRND